MNYTTPIEEEFLREVCGHCGLDRGSHCSDTLEWCPAHAQRMDYMKTSMFKETGRYFSKGREPEWGTPAINQDADRATK